MVLAQSWWVGVFGVLVSLPVVWLLAQAAAAGGAQVILRWEVLSGAAVVTVGTALMSGMFALRSVRRIQPMDLLR
jgi:putative ABC transport system permease protein